MDKAPEFKKEKLETGSDQTEAEIAKIWLQEAERRLAAYRRGELKGIPAEEIFKRVR